MYLNVPVYGNVRNLAQNTHSRFSMNKSSPSPLQKKRKNETRLLNFYSFSSENKAKENDLR